MYWKITENYSRHISETLKYEVATKSSLIFKKCMLWFFSAFSMRPPVYFFPLSMYSLSVFADFIALVQK